MAVLATLKDNCASLKECSRELWLIFLVKALESYSYFSMSITYVIFLTDSLGVGDVAAGGSYGMWGTLTVAWGIIIGPVIDHLGIRSSLLLCFAGEVISRLLIATATSKTVLYLTLYTLLPAASALGIPVMTIAIKRYTPPTSARSLAYGLFYTDMNVALLGTGFAIDALRALTCSPLTEDTTGALAALMHDSSRLIVASGAVTSGLAFVVAMFLSPAAEAEALGQERAMGVSRGANAEAAVTQEVEEALLPREAPSRQPGAPHESSAGAAHAAETGDERGDGGAAATKENENEYGGLTAMLRRLVEAAQSVKKGTVELLEYPGMWKYLAMALFLINLKQAYRYVENMLPKYMQRTMGCNAPYGRIVSINPGIIVALVPVVAALTAGLQHFDVIHCGAYITAISPFWVNWIPKPPIVGSALYVAIESIGESVWGPRWYDYTMEIAPTGKEGLFGAIAAAPLFLAKLPTGLLSGFLLDHFCPLVGEGCSVGSDSQCGGGGGAAAPGSAPQPHVERGKCDSALWVVVGVVTMTSPLLITAFSRWLKPTRGEYREGAGRADYAAAPVLEQ